MSPVIGIRVCDVDRTEIDRRAAEYGMSRTEYMIRSALDELPGTVRLADRVTETERRIARLEQIAFDV